MIVSQNTETFRLLLTNYLQSREQKWYRASIVSLLTSRRTEIATSAWEPRLQGLLAENALVQSCQELVKDDSGSYAVLMRTVSAVFVTLQYLPFLNKWERTLQHIREGEEKERGTETEPDTEPSHITPHTHLPFLPPSRLCSWWFMINWWSPLATSLSCFWPFSFRSKPMWPMRCCTRPSFLRLKGFCAGIRVELSEVEFWNLSQTNHCESICQGLLSLIKNESEWDRRRSGTVGPCATSETASEARLPSETRDLPRCLGNVRLRTITWRIWDWVVPRQAHPWAVPLQKLQEHVCRPINGTLWMTHSRCCTAVTWIWKQLHQSFICICLVYSRCDASLWTWIWRILLFFTVCVPSTHLHTMSIFSVLGDSFWANSVQCQKIAWCLFHWSWWCRIQGDHEKCAQKVGNSDASRNALQTSTCVEEHKTKYACIVEADESMRKRMEGSPHKNHQDHIAGKGMNSLSRFNLVHKIFLCSKQRKHQMRRQQRKNNERNWREYRGGSWRKSETRKKWSRKQGIKAEPYILRRWWTSVISRTRSWSLNIKNTKQSRTPRWHCERWFRIIRSIHWTGIISMTNDGCKSNGYDIKTARSRRSIILHPVQNGRYTITDQKSAVRISRYLDTSTKTQIAQILVQHGRPSRSSWAKSVRSSSARTVMGKAIRESSVGTRLGKSFKLGKFYVNREKGLFFSVHVDDIKQAGKKQNIDPMWKVLLKDVDFGRNDIVPWPCLFGLHNISAGASEKLPHSGKPDANTISSWSYDMEGRAKKCVERYCELANRTTQQLYKVATPCIDDHQFKEEELKSVGE